MFRARTVVFFFALVVSTYGCGDDGSPPPAAPDSGGRTDSGGGGTDAGRVDSGGGDTDAGGGGMDAGGGGTDAGGGGTDAGGGTGSGRVGDACGDDGDCEGSLVCKTMHSLTISTLTFPGGYCSLDCGMGGAMCPSGSECLGTVGGFGTGFCAKPCTDVSDCRSGYECRSLLPIGGGAMHCLPPGGGTGFDAGFPSFP